MFHPKLFHLTHTPDNSHAYYVAWFLSLYLISNSSTSFKLHLELNKIDFVLSSAKSILSLLSTNQSHILLKSLVKLFYFSDTYAGRASMNHLHIITSCFVQLGSYHWHKSKTTEDLKLSLTEHHIQYLWILKPDLQLLQQSDALLNRIHANWSYSKPTGRSLSSRILWFIVSNAFCRWTESCQYTIHCQNLSKFCHWEMIEIDLLNDYFGSQSYIYRKCWYHVKI